MNQDEREEATMIYKVIVNDAGQLSIWPNDQKTPKDWRDAGKIGSREFCLIYINLQHIEQVDPEE